MKRNTKGFTLIELLAVIVILAIIALIATPIILNMINDARKSASKDSAYAYVDAAEKYITMYQMNQASNGTLNTEYNEATPKGVTCTKGAEDTASSGCKVWLESFEKTVKGTKPANDSTITFDANGNITNFVLKYGDYSWTKDGNDIKEYVAA